MSSLFVYHLERKDSNPDYDTYSEFVIVSSSANQARYYSPYGEHKSDYKYNPDTKKWYCAKKDCNKLFVQDHQDCTHNVKESEKHCVEEIYEWRIRDTKQVCYIQGSCLGDHSVRAWVKDPAFVTVTEIGPVANSKYQEGDIICSSYQAG